MNSTQPTRGRPKTLDRQQVLQTAMASYWQHGPTSVSISEICESAGASKPGLYREFGSDDGLKAAVLEHYHDLVLTPMYAVLERDKPFAEIVEEFIEFVVQDRKALGIPPGCLQVSMRTNRDDLGDLTGQKVDALRGKTLGKYEQLIERVKQRGDFPAAIPTDVAALFFDAQNGSAMRMQKEGVPDEKIKAVLRQAFAVFL